MMLKVEGITVKETALLIDDGIDVLNITVLVRVAVVVVVKEMLLLLVGVEVSGNVVTVVVEPGPASIVGATGVDMVTGVTAADAPDIVTVVWSKEVAGISLVGVGFGGKLVTLRIEEPSGPCCTHTDWPMES